MAESYASIITHGLSDVEKRIATRAASDAAAPSYDSALLGAVRMIRLLKDAGVTIPEELADPMATIDDWNMAVDGSRTIVVGTASGDPAKRFVDGEVIHTSTVYTVRAEIKEGAVVSTRNSRYRLGRRATGIPASHAALTQHSGYEIVTGPKG